MQLEAGTVLDTAEGWLPQDVSAAIPVILCDIVQDLERCSAYILYQETSACMRVSRAKTYR